MFTVFTDSSANLTEGLIRQYNLSIISLHYTLDGAEYESHQSGAAFSPERFYNALRQKAEAGTSLAGTGAYLDAFSPLLEAGGDILYIGLSSGVSGTVQAARLAADELAETFPDRTVVVIDSLTGGMAQGLLACEAAKLRQQGCSLSETAEKISRMRENANIYFTVDDMFHLKRGGRLSGAAAVISTVLSIKPIMSPGMDGKIALREKIRGRKASIERLARLFAERCLPAAQTVGINHGDCAEDAEYLARLVRQSGKVKNIIINYLDPVLGVHAGPGALTIAFMGAER